jgi:hypothetical protein
VRSCRARAPMAFPTRCGTVADAAIALDGVAASGRKNKSRGRVGCVVRRADLRRLPKTGAFRNL